MPSRPDISDKVIHFTKAQTYQEALELLLTIVGEGRLVGGTGMIKGGYRCVCFTEAPLLAVAGGFVNANSFTRYSPFGLMFDKQWLYERGARPVIYQSDEEYHLLPEEIRWRHVRYEPTGTDPVDFTWEREWRLQDNELLFSPNNAVVIVPNQDWKSHVLSLWDSQQQIQVEAYSAILDQLVLEQMLEPCPWRLVSLEP